MRRPAWWDRVPEAPGWQARVLAPLGTAYAAATARRMARGGAVRVGVPVICIGNLDAGGSGKTPVVMALAERLTGWGVAVHIVSRGHGGALAGPVRVLPTHDAAAVGDEPLLLAATAPVWVARDRGAGARAAVAAGADAILMDDGFQNPGLAQDLSIVVVDAARGWGNGRAIPAGPLREGIAAGLARGSLVLSLGEDASQTEFLARWGDALRDVPHLRGAVRPLPTGMPWDGLRAFAFAGIGHPDKFFATLRGLGATLVGTQGLGDHEPYAPALLQRLRADAAALGAQLVTTEKDAVRLPPWFRARVLVLPVRLHLDDWGPIDGALAALGLQPKGSPSRLA